jgi:mono/diheme cytochrome c family protein
VLRLAALLALSCACHTAVAYEARINYMLQCMGCHTPDGSGEPGRVPSFKETLAPFARSAQGRRFLVQVPGAAQSTLSNAELAELLNWMIQNLSAGKPSHFTRYTEAEVASYRRTPLVAVQATRAKLLQSLTVAIAPWP